ncbi:MAG: hypothetical protein R2828_11250 [Saprospiraceae bacterium]
MGLEMAWCLLGLLFLSALDLRLTTSYTSALDLRLTPSRLHAGSTDIESRWDWKWLGVCLGYCCFPTFDFLTSRLFSFMLALSILNPDGIGIGLVFAWAIAAFRLTTYDLPPALLRPRLTDLHLNPHLLH